MKPFLSILLLLVLSSQSVLAQPQIVDLKTGLVLRHQLDQATERVRPFLFDPKVRARIEAWVFEPAVTNYFSDCQFHLRPFFQSERLIGPLCYLLRQPSPRRELSLNLVERYVMEVGAALFELQNDPQYSLNERAKAQKWSAQFLDLNGSGFRDYRAEFKKCFLLALRMKYSVTGTPFSPFASVTSCLRSSFPQVRVQLSSGATAQMPFFSVNLAVEFQAHPGHAISPTGWVPGNKVTYHTENDTSPEMESFLDAKADLMTKFYPLSGRGSVAGFDSASVDESFTEAEGFDSISQHPVWNQSGGIFSAFLKGIESAEESIFIDIFFLGGTMGASLSKFLIDQLELKPRLKIFILRDNVNHFGHEEEMRPVFNFLYSYSKRNPSRLVIAESYIEGRRSGLPPFLQDLVTDDLLKKTGLQGHLALYGRAMSDHSKVMVVDGLSANPRAWVGSKNLTDSSGAFCFDEVVEVAGPGAAVILDDYYWDMKAALLQKMTRGPYADYLAILAKSGWAANSLKPGATPEEIVADVLRPFDLLNRTATGDIQPGGNLKYTPQGSVWLRTGLNNVDSTRTNTVDQVIQSILKAKTRILIKDQLLFDRNIVGALLRVKQANPSLDIRVILDPIKGTQPQGLPNLLYLDVLADAGIKAKWRLTKANPKISQEYHMKTVSIDGEYLISGSANKDPNTMIGAFREEQIHLWDKNTTGVHDQAFEVEWNDPTKTSEEFKEHKFEVPYGLKGFDGSPLDPKEMIQLIRGLMTVFYEATVR